MATRVLGLMAVAAVFFTVSCGGGEERPSLTTPTPTEPTEAKPNPTDTATSTQGATATPSPAAHWTPTPTAPRSPIPASRPSATATPSLAPAPETLADCSHGTAVPEAEVNPGLVEDCAVLLEALAILVGSGPAPNWTATKPITEWEGVTVDGVSTRVSEIDLSYRRLAGEIP